MGESVHQHAQRLFLPRGGVSQCNDSLLLVRGVYWYLAHFNDSPAAFQNLDDAISLTRYFVLIQKAPDFFEHHMARPTKLVQELLV